MITLSERSSPSRSVPPKSGLEQAARDGGELLAARLMVTPILYAKADRHPEVDGVEHERAREKRERTTAK